MKKPSWSILRGGCSIGKLYNRGHAGIGNIKLIQVPIAGIEKLDFELLSRYDIPVCNSHSNALPVAETALALLLGIAKKIPTMIDS